MKKQKVQAKINLEALAGGAFAEKLNEALMQVAENIQNPNTEATTKRQITVNIKFTPNKTRQMVGTQIAVTTKLAATEAIDTQMVMGVNIRIGQIEIAEYDGQIRGQMDLSDFTDTDQDQEPEGSQTLRRSRQGRADQSDHSHLSGGLYQGKPRGTPRQNDHSGGKRHKGAALLRTAGRA